jgi:hypothetical protein
MPHLESQIPQRVQQRLDEALFSAPDRRATQHQEIDVGVEELGFATVSADGKDRERRLRVDTRAVDEFADDAVDALRMAGQRGASAFAAFSGVDELLSRDIQRRRKAKPKLRLIDVSSLSRAHRHP